MEQAKRFEAIDAPRLATDEYRAIVQGYPGTPEAKAAEAAIQRLEQAKATEEKAKATEDAARRQRDEDAERRLNPAQRREIDELMNRGKLAEGRRLPVNARISYRTVIEKYPDSPAAKEAQKAIERLAQ